MSARQNKKVQEREQKVELDVSDFLPAHFVLIMHKVRRWLTGSACAILGPSGPLVPYWGHRSGWLIDRRCQGAGNPGAGEWRDGNWAGGGANKVDGRAKSPEKLWQALDCLQDTI